MTEEKARVRGLGGQREDEAPPAQGERTIASVNRVRSVQSRMTSLLAMGLIVLLGAGVLGWYYTQAFARTEQGRATERGALSRRAESEMPLPALAVPSVPSGPIAKLLGPPPPPLEPAATQHAPVKNTVQRTSPHAAADRRLKAAVFVPLGDSTSIRNVTGSSDAVNAMPQAASESNNGLSSLLVPATTVAVQAKLLPTQRLLLPKGAFLDCTLETAIDSSLPGMTTCVTATDNYGVDGTVVLLERGTKLVGETRGEVKQGSSRLFVLWTEARTPKGVVIPLASPGTDQLGRSGMDGDVERHFWSRFGAAMLVSIVDGVVDAASRSATRSGGISVRTGAAARSLRRCCATRSVSRQHFASRRGDRIQVLVARDLDFRGVYRLQRVEP